MHDLVHSRFGHKVVLLMFAVALVLGAAPKFAFGGFSPTLASQDATAEDLDKIRGHLENKKVSETLASLGYSKGEIEERLALLSPEEISSLAGQLDQSLVPNGSAAGIIIGAVVVILVALGILSLMGKKVTVST
ncbi:MAG: PA2779 family protein [Deltaproteobacteria bacterium]|jgi:hypothetical protein|nr:PA2779 family protein [Deltaproteobacteria bacterium]